MYTKNLVENLLKIDKKNQYVLFGSSLRRKNELRSFAEKLKNQGYDFEHYIYSYPPTMLELMFNRLRFPQIERFIGDIDIFHSSDWTMPRSKAKRVTTVHDLVPILYSEQSDDKIVSVFRRTMAIARNEIDVFIAPSYATKADMIKLGFDKKKISVISEAADNYFKKARRSEIEIVKKKFKINGKYLLSVGTAPRKNIKNIVKAYNLLKKKYNLNLAVVGESQRSKLNTDSVLELGRVTKKELRALYSGAEALVYPSFYEGFGLPILEAYACGTGVITSNSGSMKEVGGYGAELVDPNSHTSIAKGVEMVLSQKEKYAAAGKIEVRKYSWEKTARETLKIYEKIRTH